MDAATGDLRRQDPRQATASGGRALQQLEEVQRQMQAAQPDERRRAMGDMQLEARQLADEQRAIATEQGRTGRGEQGADTRRRLAGEQERLAERVRRLQNGLESQANAPQEGGRGRRQAQGRESSTAAEQARNAARDASREIERQRLPDRMQQSASEMRSAAAADPKAQGQTQREQEEVARALDRLADRIGQAVRSGDEASRQIGEQLTRAQDLRDRIDSLTRELAQLSQQTGPGSPGDAARLRDDYNRRLQEARQLLDQIGRDNPEVKNGGIGFTFEGQGMVMSAPGTEPFKQDFAKWEQLRKQVTLALDRAESELSRKLQARDTRDRLAAGVDDEPPAAYQHQVDDYFKSLAGKRKPQ
jgi:chromosome segregation ATPase